MKLPTMKAKKPDIKAQTERLRKIAKKGGNAVVAKHGTEHMRTIGRKGGLKAWGKNEQPNDADNGTP